MERFAFGENWTEFAKRLRPEDYAAAKESLRQLMPDLEGRTFLDIGSGSGLFSAAASALGARKVVGFDLDPQAVTAAKSLIHKIAQWDRDVRKDVIEFRIESILNEGVVREQFDIVYSWGVLHHTGDMYQAFEAAIKLVAQKGTLVIAIYNKHFTSPIWKMIKFTYVKSPKFAKNVLVYSILAVKFLAAVIISRRNPLKRDRGMRFYTDIVDWVGGYPYECASVSEVSDFFGARGFRLTKFNKTKGCTGCNEFVLEKVR